MRHLDLPGTGLCIILCAFLCLAPGCLHAQPGDLVVEGNYVHQVTRVVFPEQIEQYRRKGIRAYDAGRSDVGASYEWRTQAGQSLITVYVYPAGDGREGRLRDAYLGSLNDMRNTVGPGVALVQFPRSNSQDGYRINGFTGTLESMAISRVTVFECGQWFFKMRTTTNLLDTAEVSVLESRVLESFKPASMVKDFPLNITGSILVTKDAMRDTVMAAATIGSTLQKLSWARQHVDSLERLSGFPDLYLAMHQESINKFLDLAQGNEGKRKSSTTKYIKEWMRIKESGFLMEYLAEQCQGVVRLPKGTVLDEERYREWKRKYKPKVDLSERFSLVTYKMAE
ncbi:MAG: hypothetical protein JNN04_13645 [Cyclobacteriaceae bacterium]|nr:hypothetical protein [Cyclobacteriaceae bacterium]